MFLGNHGTVDLSIWFEFQLDVLKRFGEKCSYVIYTILKQTNNLKMSMRRSACPGKSIFMRLSLKNKWDCGATYFVVFYPGIPAVSEFTRAYLCTYIYIKITKTFF